MLTFNRCCLRTYVLAHKDAVLLFSECIWMRAGGADYRCGVCALRPALVCHNLLSSLDPDSIDPRECVRVQILSTLVKRPGLWLVNYITHKESLFGIIFKAI